MGEYRLERPGAVAGEFADLPADQTGAQSARRRAGIHQKRVGWRRQNLKVPLTLQVAADEVIE
jgi:hypothetical protein